MKKHEVETLVDVIRSMAEPEGKPAAVPPGGTKAKGCDHKFIGSNKCAKCGKNGGEIADESKAFERTQREATGNMGEHIAPFDDAALERQYQAFKNRIIEEAAIDPVLLHLLTVRPEIVVEVERKVIALNGGEDLKGRIARLIAAGFLSSPRKAGHINNELERTGTKAAGNRLSEALAWLKKAGFLVEEDTGWNQAPGVKVTERTIEK